MSENNDNDEQEVLDQNIEKEGEDEQTMNEPLNRDVRALLIQRTGMAPRDAFSWLYACRGLYKLKQYHLVVDGLTHCLRNSKTTREAQHLLAFSLFYLKQYQAAAPAFYKSVKLGNDTDWQPLVELCIDNPDIAFGSPYTK